MKSNDQETFAKPGAEFQAVTTAFKPVLANSKVIAYLIFLKSRAEPMHYGSLFIDTIFTKRIPF